MKNEVKLFLLLFLFGISIALVSCDKEDDEDLTIELVGEYIGAYGSNTNGDIDPYEIVVAKVNNNTVSVGPKSGNEFTGLEIEVVRSATSTINSSTDNNQQLESSVIFAIGTPVAMTLSIDPTGDAHTFVGEKQ